jgi:UDP-N-acetylglucosamine 1-carboxyvinyltransferase
MEDAFIIHGGNKLEGTVAISGAKNVALKVLTAALLFKGRVVLQNVPRIRDVAELINLIHELGGAAEFTGPNTVTVEGFQIKEKTLDMLYASKIRTSFMFFAPLLYIFGEAHIPNPGGCRLGARPIDRIINGMQALGIQVDYDSDSGFFHAKLIQPVAGRFRFPKVSHTGTELLIMLAVLSTERVIIENAALEPEVDDLIRFLNEAGAQIIRTGGTITIQGVAELKQTAPFTITADRNEAVTYAVLAIATNGSIVLEELRVEDLKAFNDELEKAGGGIEHISETSIRYFYKGPIKPLQLVTEPHPGFMTDWQPPMAVFLTQAEGDSVIHEKMFENRFSYVDELKKLGADIEFISPEVENPSEFYEFNYDPEKEYKQAIKIHGPQELHNGVLQIADLRAGATLAIAALIAHGKTIIHGASHLERGYENFVGKVSAIGGKIEKI